MDKQKIEEILKQIAKANDVSVEEVRREIQAALAVSNLPHLTPEEAIAHFAKRVKEKM